MTTKNFRVRNGLTIGGATSGSTSLNNSATGTDISYTLPTAQGASATVLTNDGSGTLSWALPGGGGSTFGNVTIGITTDNTISTTTGNLVIDSATNVVQVDAQLVNNTTSTNTMTINSVVTSNAVGVLNLWTTSTGTPAVGFGPSLLATSELGNGDEMTVGSLSWVATDMTANNEDFEIQLAATKNGALPDNKVYIDSEGNVKADGDLALNYSFSKPNANINAYSSLGNGQITWTGTVWDITNPVNIDGKLTLAGAGPDISFIPPSSGSLQDYTLPDAYPGVSGYVLSSTTGGTMSWVANPDTNTTYTIDASTTTGGANFNLTGSDSTTDTIKYANGTGITAVATDASTITLTNTGVTSNVAGTGISVSGATGAVTITNSGVTSAVAGTGIGVSGSTGAVTFSNTGVTSAVAGTGVSVSSSTGAVTFSIGQSVATTASPTFAAGSFSSLILRGSTSGTNTISSPAVAGTVAYTLPTGYPASSGYVLSSTTGGTMSWVAQSGGGSSTTDFTPSFLLGGM